MSSRGLRSKAKSSDGMKDEPENSPKSGKRGSSECPVIPPSKRKKQIPQKTTKSQVGRQNTKKKKETVVLRKNKKLSLSQEVHSDQKGNPPCLDSRNDESLGCDPSENDGPNNDKEVKSLSHILSMSDDELEVIESNVSSEIESHTAEENLNHVKDKDVLPEDDIAENITPCHEVETKRNMNECNKREIKSFESANESASNFQVNSSYKEPSSKSCKASNSEPQEKTVPLENCFENSIETENEIHGEIASLTEEIAIVDAAPNQDVMSSEILLTKETTEVKEIKTKKKVCLKLDNDLSANENAIKETISVDIIGSGDAKDDHEEIEVDELKIVKEVVMIENKVKELSTLDNDKDGQSQCDINSDPIHKKTETKESVSENTITSEKKCCLDEMVVVENKTKELHVSHRVQTQDDVNSDQINPEGGTTKSSIEPSIENTIKSKTISSSTCQDEVMIVKNKVEESPVPHGAQTQGDTIPDKLQPAIKATDPSKESTTKNTIKSEINRSPSCQEDVMIIKNKFVESPVSHCVQAQGNTFSEQVNSGIETKEYVSENTIKYKNVSSSPCLAEIVKVKNKVEESPDSHVAHAKGDMYSDNISPEIESKESASQNTIKSENISSSPCKEETVKVKNKVEEFSVSHVAQATDNMSSDKISLAIESTESKESVSENPIETEKIRSPTYQNEMEVDKKEVDELSASNTTSAQEPIGSDHIHPEIENTEFKKSVCENTIESEDIRCYQEEIDMVHQTKDCLRLDKNISANEDAIKKTLSVDVIGRGEAKSDQEAMEVDELKIVKEVVTVENKVKELPPSHDGQAKSDINSDSIHKKTETKESVSENTITSEKKCCSEEMVVVQNKIEEFSVSHDNQTQDDINSGQINPEGGTIKSSQKPSIENTIKSKIMSSSTCQDEVMMVKNKVEESPIPHDAQAQGDTIPDKIQPAIEVTDLAKESATDNTITSEINRSPSCQEEVMIVKNEFVESPVSHGVQAQGNTFSEQINSEIETKEYVSENTIKSGNVSSSPCLAEIVKVKNKVEESPDSHVAQVKGDMYSDNISPEIESASQNTIKSENISSSPCKEETVKVKNKVEEFSVSHVAQAKDDMSSDKISLAIESTESKESVSENPIETEKIRSPTCQNEMEVDKKEVDELTASNTTSAQEHMGSDHIHPEKEKTEFKESVCENSIESEDIRCYQEGMDMVTNHTEELPNLNVAQNQVSVGSEQCHSQVEGTKFKKALSNITSESLNNLKDSLRSLNNLFGNEEATKETSCVVNDGRGNVNDGQEKMDVIEISDDEDKINQCNYEKAKRQSELPRTEKTGKRGSSESPDITPSKKKKQTSEKTTKSQVNKQNTKQKKKTVLSEKKSKKKKQTPEKTTKSQAKRQSELLGREKTGKRGSSESPDITQKKKKKQTPEKTTKSQVDSQNTKQKKKIVLSGKKLKTKKQTPEKTTKSLVNSQNTKQKKKTVLSGKKLKKKQTPEKTTKSQVDSQNTKQKKKTVLSGKKLKTKKQTPEKTTKSLVNSQNTKQKKKTVLSGKKLKKKQTPEKSTKSQVNRQITKQKKKTVLSGKNKKPLNIPCLGSKDDECLQREKTDWRDFVPAMNDPVWKDRLPPPPGCESPPPLLKKNKKKKKKKAKEIIKKEEDSKTTNKEERKEKEKEEERKKEEKVKKESIKKEVKEGEIEKIKPLTFQFSVNSYFNAEKILKSITTNTSGQFEVEFKINHLPKFTVDYIIKKGVRENEIKNISGATVITRGQFILPTLAWKLSTGQSALLKSLENNKDGKDKKNFMKGSEKGAQAQVMKLKENVMERSSSETKGLGGTACTEGQHNAPVSTLLGNPAGWKPLHLYVKGPSRESLESALACVKKLIAEGEEHEDINKDQVFLSLCTHAPADFNLCGRVMGEGGANLHYIMEQTGAEVTLRGQTSGYKELSGLEHPDLLHLRIRHKRLDGLIQAKEIAFHLMRTVIVEFKEFSNLGQQVSSAKAQPGGQLSSGMHPATVSSGSTVYSVNCSSIVSKVLLASGLAPLVKAGSVGQQAGFPQENVTKTKIVTASQGASTVTPSTANTSQYSPSPPQVSSAPSKASHLFTVAGSPLAYSNTVAQQAIKPTSSIPQTKVVYEAAPQLNSSSSSIQGSFKTSVNSSSNTSQSYYQTQVSSGSSLQANQSFQFLKPSLPAPRAHPRPLVQVPSTNTAVPPPLRNPPSAKPVHLQQSSTVASPEARNALTFRPQNKKNEIESKVKKSPKKISKSDNKPKKIKFSIITATKQTKIVPGNPLAQKKTSEGQNEEEGSQREASEDTTESLPHLNKKSNTTSRWGQKPEEVPQSNKVKQLIKKLSEQIRGMRCEGDKFRLNKIIKHLQCTTAIPRTQLNEKEETQLKVIVELLQQTLRFFPSNQTSKTLWEILTTLKTDYNIAQKEKSSELQNMTSTGNNKTESSMNKSYNKADDQEPLEGRSKQEAERRETMRRETERSETERREAERRETERREMERREAERKETERREIERRETERRDREKRESERREREKREQERKEQERREQERKERERREQERKERERHEQERKERERREQERKERERREQERKERERREQERKERERREQEKQERERREQEKRERERGERESFIKTSSRRNHEAHSSKFESHESKCKNESSRSSSNKSGDQMRERRTDFRGNPLQDEKFPSNQKTSPEILSGVLPEVKSEVSTPSKPSKSPPNTELIKIVELLHGALKSATNSIENNNLKMELSTIAQLLKHALPVGVEISDEGKSQFLIVLDVLEQALQRNKFALGQKSVMLTHIIVLLKNQLNPNLTSANTCKQDDTQNPMGYKNTDNFTHTSSDTKQMSEMKVKSELKDQQSEIIFKITQLLQKAIKTYADTLKSGAIKTQLTVISQSLEEAASKSGKTEKEKTNLLKIIELLEKLLTANQPSSRPKELLGVMEKLRHVLKSKVHESTSHVQQSTVKTMDPLKTGQQQLLQMIQLLQRALHSYCLSMDSGYLKSQMTQISQMLDRELKEHTSKMSPEQLKKQISPLVQLLHQLLQNQPSSDNASKQLIQILQLIENSLNQPVAVNPINQLPTNLPDLQQLQMLTLQQQMQGGLQMGMRLPSQTQTTPLASSPLDSFVQLQCMQMMQQLQAAMNSQQANPVSDQLKQFSQQLQNLQNMQRQFAQASQLSPQQQFPQVSQLNQQQPFQSPAIPPAIPQQHTLLQQFTAAGSQSLTRPSSVNQPQSNISDLMLQLQQASQQFKGCE